MNRDAFHFGICSPGVRLNRRAFLLLSGVAACASPARSAIQSPPIAERADHPAPTAATAKPETPPATPPNSVAAIASSAGAAPVSFGNAPLGGDGPLVLEHADSQGRWLAFCQARQDSNADGQLSVTVGPRGQLAGDEVRRYLLSPSAELPIDSFLSAAPGGRFALVTRGGALLLWDSATETTLDLSAWGADGRQSAESFAAPRTLAFDRSGEHLLYVRRGPSGARVVLRSLLEGTERDFDPGLGEVWRARFDPGGVFLTLEMISSDSNKNGRLDFPAPLLSAPRACSGSPAPFHTWVDRGDRPETVLLPIAGGPPVHEPELIMPVRDALLLRDPSGALLLERAGKKRLLEPGECKGRIIHADGERDLYIVGCAQKKKKTGRVSLELVTKEGRKPLNIELASVELDRELSDSARLVPLYPGADSALFDADKRELIPIQAGDAVITTRAAHALIRRGSSLVWYDAETHHEQLLPEVLDKYPEILVTPPFSFVSPVLVNLDTGVVVGTSKQRPLALSETGQLLIAASDPDGSTLARGPLHWFSPAP